jgi:hypothetical protein
LLGNNLLTDQLPNIMLSNPAVHATGLRKLT